MKTKLCLLAFMTILLTCCIDEKDTDAEKPKIQLLSPLPCDTLYFGQEVHFRIKIDDNTGLGNISMDVHHNFGHHSHGNHESCQMDGPKDPVNPYVGNWVFALPENETSFVLDTTIVIPGTDAEESSFDTGDYHYHIYVTDNDGYQTFTTMDVKKMY